MSKLTVTLCSDISKQNEHRFVNARINSYTKASTSCEILAKIGAVALEFKRAKIKICRDSAAI